MPTGNEYSTVIYGQQEQSYKTTERESVGGEYGLTDQPNLNGVFVGDNMVPEPVPSMQFSSKMSGDPKELLAGSTDCIEDHASIVRAYGLNMPLATLGSHPWLRDSLANPSEDEPGNMEPVAGKKIPGMDT